MFTDYEIGIIFNLVLLIIVTLCERVRRRSGQEGKAGGRVQSWF